MSFRVLLLGVALFAFVGCGGESAEDPGTVRQELGNGNGKGKGKGKGKGGGGGPGHGGGGPGGGPPASCTPGERICDAQGRARECNPAGKPGRVFHCDEDELCYGGYCSTGDLVALPPVVESGLVDTAVATVALEHDAIVLPYEAFAAAITGRPFEPASAQVVEHAAALSAFGNDGTVAGITATFTEASTFDGELFVVLVEPQRVMSGTQEQVEASRYFVAAVQLQGFTSWVGHTAAFVQGAPSSIGAVGVLPGDCCGPRLGELTCFTPGGGGGSGPGGPGGPGGPACGFLEDCQPNFAVGVSVDPAVEQFHTGNGGDFSGEISLRPNGQPVVPLVSFGERGSYVDGFGPSDQAALGAELDRVVLGFPAPGDTPPPPPAACQTCNQFLCPGGSDPDTGGGGWTDPPESCGAAPGEVSRLCMQSDAAGCIATCGDCVRESGANCALGGIGTEGGFGMHHGMVGVCGDQNVPDYCAAALGGDECECDATCQQARGEAIAAASGCLVGLPSADFTCEGSYACKTIVGSNSTTELCMTCTAEGGCVSTAYDLGPSSRFNESEAEAENECSDVDVPCEVIDDFEDDHIVGTVDEDGDPEPAPEPVASPADTPEVAPPAEPAETNTPTPTPFGFTDWLDTHAYGDFGTLDTSEPPSSFTQGPTQKQSASPNPTQAFKPNLPTAADGDPVLLGSGEFTLDPIDLSFAGAAGPLQFQRLYRSGSDDRSILGSNWSHNYDFWLQPLTPENAPVWADPYCTQWAPEVTCVVLHEPSGARQMFMRTAEAGQFRPQSGSTDTLSRRGQRWVLLSADKRQMHFNDAGAMTRDIDRFGNGVHVEYELMPLYLAYTRYCHRRPTGPNWVDHADFDPRVCTMLGYALGERGMPSLQPEGWEPLMRPAPQTLTQLRMPIEFDRALSAAELDLLGPLVPDLTLAFEAQLEAARTRLQALIARGTMPELPTGHRKLRPVRVTDELGRELTFSYYDDVSDPRDGLLQQVQGPASTRVAFDYAQPPDYPERLNEVFLTTVTRSDGTPPAGVVAAPTRTTTYTYDWGSSIWLEHADALRAQYAQYYHQFVGCEYLSIVPCFVAVPVPSAGNPCFLAELAAHRYISSVADNIVTVQRNAQIVESETRFATDPHDPSFDRVIAQRYGGLPTDGQPAVDVWPPWSTDLPQVQFEYLGAAPLAADVDVTEVNGFLPLPLQEIYPMEPAGSERDVLDCANDPTVCAHEAPAPEDDGPGCVFEDGGMADGAPVYQYAHTQHGASCNPVRRRELQAQLPGATPTLQYFDPEPAYHDAEQQYPRLRRSRLTCEQLATWQVANAAHNDNLRARVLEDGEVVYDWVTGFREQVERNARRICAWSRVTDRDGAVAYRGLNYRGQALVHAIAEEDGVFWVKEQLPNADGLLVQDRRPVLATWTGWSPDAGVTLHEYEEIVPQFQGDPQGERPFFWSRRGNRVRTVELPSSAGSVAVQWDGTSIEATEVAGRVTSYRYDPLYNELTWMQSGTLAQPAQTETFFDLDYQELTFASDAFQEALDLFHQSGARLLAPGDDLSFVRDFQVAAHMYGADLNGDEVHGLLVDTEGQTHVRGVPVRIVVKDHTTAESPEHRIYLQYAPNGQPSMVATPERITRLSYYARTGAPGVVSAGYGGLLGRVVTDRIDDDHAPHGAGGCAELPGPYQYLVPGCASGAVAALGALGVPAEVATALRDAAQPERAEITQLTYAVTGHPREVTTDGLTTEFLRDTDGRLAELTDPAGTHTVWTRTLDGWPRKEVTTEASGTTLAVTVRQFDDEGRVLTTCQPTRSASGCLEVEAIGFPVSTGATIATDDPPYVLHRMRYSGEGQLALHVDPANVETHYAVNARKQLTERRTTNPGLGEDRVVRVHTDADGQVTAVRHGSDATRAAHGALDATYIYDGESRLRTVIDPRGTSWQLGYDARGAQTAVKQSPKPYAPGAADSPSWQVLTQLDGLYRPVLRDFHGLQQEHTTFDAAGNPVAVQRTGEGVTLHAYDTSGHPVWTRDAAGTQHVAVFDPIARKQSTVTLRQEDGEVLTTSTIDTLDPRGAIVQRRVVGDGGEEQLTTVTRDGFGALSTAYTTAGGEVLAALELQRNLLGWPTHQRDRTEGAFAETTYNGRGLPTAVQDPSGQSTTRVYSAFGEVITHAAPHNATGESWTYDGYGRVATHTTGGAAIAMEYDGRGDLVRQRWSNAGTPDNVLAERAYDDLGRIISTRDSNLGRISFGAAAVDVHHTFAYDALGRRTSESVRVGNGTSFTTSTTWTPDVGDDGWWRDVVYPSGKLVSRRLDAVGRLDRVELDGRVIDLDWLGEIPVGRTHAWSADSSIDPMRRRVTLDGLGRGVHLETTMLAGPAAAPSNPGWADAYCEGAYDATVCGAPLFAQEILRDPLGRARSVQTLWGNPEAGEVADRPMPWRGYQYDEEGRLSTVFEHAGVTDPIVATLAPHTITNAVIDAFVASAPSTEPIVAVDWVREAEVGGVLEVVERATGATRFLHDGPRDAGHKLGAVELDAATYLIEHDTAGRVTTGAGATFDYGPRGRLLRADRAGQHEEYVYGADGRLAMTINGKDYVLAHDGDQMIAAMEQNGVPAWEVVAGVQPDEILEYEAINFPATGRYIPVTDHRNSIVGWWNATTAQTEHILEYTPYGRIRLLSPDGTLRCEEEGSGTDCVRQWSLPPFGFAGAYRSALTGVSYMRARWYSPKLGQFLTEDPLGAIDSYNPYAYAAMDPINLWDPYGLASQGTAITGIPVVDYGFGAVHGYASMYADIAMAGVGTAMWLSKYRYPWNIPRQLVRDLEIADAVVSELKEDPSQVLPFAGMSEEGLEARKALAKGDYHYVGYHGTRAVYSFILDLGGAATAVKLVGKGSKLAKAARVCSFTAGTVVLMCDGSYQPIETVEAGDLVLARDDTTGELACKEVVDPYANPRRSIIVLELQADDGTVEAIETTDNHPFYVADHGWTRVDELIPGDEIQSADGTVLTVVSALWTTRIETVYNFGVDRYHTYFVGEVGAWVHNCKTIVRSIHKDRLLVREAEAAGKSVQDSLDALQHQLARGNLNPGRGSKSLGFGGIHEARAKDGARVYFRNIDEQTLEIVGKSSKHNQEKVISRLRTLYDN